MATSSSINRPFSLGILVIFFAAAPAFAQRIEVEAFVGKPFGVGRITLDLPAEMLPQPLGVEGLVLTEPAGRVLYPALESAAFGRVMREVLDAETPLTSGGPIRQQVGGILRGLADRPPRTTIFFLFRGDEPLQMTMHARSPISIPLAPRNAPRQFERLLALWWKQYAKEPKLLEQKPDYPPQVENYLMCMLATRLNLRLPESKQTKSAYSELEKELGLAAGTEALRVAMQQDRILGLHNLNEPADRPLPPAFESPPLAVPETPGDVPIEPLAQRVPAECFYVRFGSFANFLWLQDTLEKWGGDLQNLVALRGLDHDMRGRIERQLILKQDVLSRLLGDTVVADVAIVGNDMFFREGASYGILFQARNALLLGTTLAAQRTARLKAGGAAEEKVKIAGREFSFISTRDGSVRSYYVPDGDYVLVTSSKKLAERFLATGKGKDEEKISLGASPEFRYARTIMPLSRGDAVFVYLSDAFFRNITSPHYRVEMARRLQSVADIELVQLAKLAAASEGKPGDSIDALVQGNFLPPSFGPLPDGSRMVLAGGEVHDGLRGWRGTYLPIPDMPVDRVSAFEEAEYRRFADYYRAQWGRMDPVLVGLARKPLPENREQVTADVMMAPIAPRHLELFKKYAGPPSNERVAPIPGDLAAFDAVLANQRLFGGLRDFGPPPNLQFGRLLPMGRLRDWLVGYLGCTGDLGFLRVLNIGFPPPDANGYSTVRLTGGWRRMFGPFTVFSFQPEILAEVTPQIRFEQAERPAQLRLRIDDPTRSRIMPLANGWAYNRTRETTLNNLRLLQALDQQLHVPPPSCKEAAEFLLDAKLKCPLGGEYVYKSLSPLPSPLSPQSEGEGPGVNPDNFGRWTSTALENQSAGGSFLHPAAPPDFQAPPLNWFRGLDLEAVINEKNLSAHAAIIMQLPEKK
ncbi:MAG: hypothetical protein IT426_07415 [Pirellulales bacterium]|nr:hypothetical protein [Pirellulales bacterium]